jgi:drug/metabolite transporter (DMT)-like permease
MAVILVYTTPIWVMPMAIFIFKERSTLMKWVGVALGLSGVLIMLNPWVLDWTIKNTQIGILFLMLASLSMSISILCAKYMTWHHTPLQMIPWQLLVGSILLTMTATIMDPHPALHWNLTSSFSIAYTAIASTAFGFYGMTKLSKELPATVTSIGLLGVPVSGVFFSVIFLHERFNESMLLAMIFIITGVFTVIWGERKAG